MQQSFKLRAPVSAALTHTPPPTRMPNMIYGTAWKKDQSDALVSKALQSGFRGIDTACQPRHYNEALVGAGARSFLLLQPEVKREDLYIQTKFSPRGGQDAASCPYDPDLRPAEQVAASVAVSMRNLQLGYIDTLVLHSPFDQFEDTVEAWKAMFSYTPYSSDKNENIIHNIGVSNVDLQLLKRLVAKTGIYPSVVQNRLYRSTMFDIPLRKWCTENDVIYQSFWSLTANPDLLRHERISQVAQKHGLSSAVALYAVILSEKNICVLNGTTDEEHMKEDLVIAENNPLAGTQELSKLLGVL
ncbi:NADP-dependent oxidoreductase domain-containing protein [Kockiozyma suomiensis]|uniref:NADP-dependent oxidoreductase domain-containing protein n=1 Tax=Kockiozyma suomiensis TaxID=1337062 RepID=UPI003343C4A8